MTRAEEQAARDAKRAVKMVGVLGGMAALGALGKVTGVLDVSWPAATSPLWAPFAVAFLVRWTTAMVYAKWWEIEQKRISPRRNEKEVGGG